MKNIVLIHLLLWAFVFDSQDCFAQNGEEAVLRNIEQLERNAILKGDTVMLLKLMSPNIVVHNPENTIVVGLKQIFARIKGGRIDYASFDRTIEKITVVENIGIVMGQEIIKPQGVTMHHGKTVTRRFTNIWMKQADQWKLTARQATIISVE